MENKDRVYSAIKARYGRAARTSGCCASTAGSSCCAPTPGNSSASCCGGSANLEGPTLGCGRPLLRADLKDGEVVLDIGSGAGQEVIAAASQVAPHGLALGLDMTDEMLAVALENRQKAGAFNAFFVKGTMESIPLAAKSVDVIISNCVINLSPDKQAALAELFRVLRPGGRLAISDTVVRGSVPESAKADASLWCECLSGSMQVDEYRRRLESVGFAEASIDVEVWYDGVSMEKDGWQAGSAFVSAVRPR